MCTGAEAALIAGAGIGAGGNVASAAMQPEPPANIQLPPQPDFSSFFENDDLMQMLMPKPQMGMGGF